MCHVLIVDDDASRREKIADLVREILPEAEQVPLDAYLPAKAWLIQHPNDSVLLIADLFLQGGGQHDPGEGLQLIRDLRTANRDDPAILISGFEPLKKLAMRLADLNDVVCISLHYSSVEMWDKLEEAITDFSRTFPALTT